MTPRHMLLALLIQSEDWMIGDPPIDFYSSLKNHDLWLTEEHCGDCTNVSGSCVVCASQYREALVDAAFAFLDKYGFVLSKKEVNTIDGK